MCRTNPVTQPQSARCNACTLAAKRPAKDGKCLECGKAITRAAKRCKSCNLRSGPSHPRWGGGRFKTPKGYVMVNAASILGPEWADHPRLNSKGHILEHIAVMETKIGRRLRPGENVHHLNGVKDDNRPENLELWVTKQPLGQRPADLVAHAKEILALYGDGDY